MNETNHPSSLATCTLIQDFLGVKDGGIYEAVVQLKQQLEAREREVISMVLPLACLIVHGPNKPQNVPNAMRR